MKNLKCGNVQVWSWTMKLVRNLNSGKYEIVKKPYIEINDIEQLMKLIKDVDNEIIVSEDRILIYDYYIE